MAQHDGQCEAITKPFKSLNGRSERCRGDAIDALRALGQDQWLCGTHGWQLALLFGRAGIPHTLRELQHGWLKRARAGLWIEPGRSEGTVGERDE